MDRSITKIELVGRTGVLLRFSGERKSLWLTSHPELSRVGLVETPPSLGSPRRAGAALGDALHGARLIGVESEIGGRVATFRFAREAKHHARLALVAELIPRFANLVLVGDENMILWSRREFTGAGRAREIHAGVTYTAPTPPTPRDAAPLEIAPGSSANDDADRRFRARELDEERAQLRTALRRTFVRRREKAAKALRHIERRLEEAKEEPAIRRHGELLAANLGRARRGMTSVLVPDFDGSGEISIPLDPKLDAKANLEAIFRRARRLARAGGDLETQQRIQVSTIEEADAVVAKLESKMSDEELIALASRHLADTERGDVESPVSLAKTGRARGPSLPSGFLPRRYVLPGGWEVWVGRSAAQNDELTHKVAAPRDLWFHARGAQGSHAVLRISSGKGEPEKGVIEAAAAIAAFHSKARTSKLVPVAYTERRFVRKPRGAPPGTASIQRETVIFVQPRVPQERAEDPL